MTNGNQLRLQQADTLPAYFAFATQSGRSLVSVNTIAWMLGLVAMFSLLAVSASAAGQLLIQNQNRLPLTLINSTVVMAFGVMSLLGTGLAGIGREPSSMLESTVRGSSALAATVAIVRTQD